MEKIEGCVGIYRGLKTNFGLGFRILKKIRGLGLGFGVFQKDYGVKRIWVWGLGLGFGVVQQDLGL